MYGLIAISRQGFSLHLGLYNEVETCLWPTAAVVSCDRGRLTVDWLALQAGTDTIALNLFFGLYYCLVTYVMHYVTTVESAGMPEGLFKI